MRKFQNSFKLVFILLIVFIAGCIAVGPDYRLVQVEVPEAWPVIESNKDTEKQTADMETLARWWTTLEDSILNDLLERAVSNNKDLKIALTRIRQSRGALGVAGKQLAPTITGSAQYSRSQSAISTDEEPDPEVFSTGSNYFNAGFDASWEIDLFGKIRRGIEAATAELEASEEGYRSVLISLFSETASNYVRLRTLQQQLEIVNRNLELQESVLGILEDQEAAGLIGSLRVQQSRYNIESTRARVPAYRISIEETLNTLAILLGELPGTLHDELSTPGPIPVPKVEIAIGIPADILRRRPDIRNAERMLAAQTARVGVATADLYPIFRLSGFLGMTATSADAFFSDTSPTASITPFVSVPIFNRGKIRDQIEIQSAIQERYLIEYETIVLDAIKEVRDAIVAYGEEHKRYRILDTGAEQARSAIETVNEQFDSGLVNFLDVLDAQRNLLLFEENQVGSRGSIAQNLIRLYKALGGGWTPAS